MIDLIERRMWKEGIFGFEFDAEGWRGGFARYGAGGLQRDMAVRARRASAGEGSSSAVSVVAASTSYAAFDAKSVAERA
jgi:hypothetical protein